MKTTARKIKENVAGAKKTRERRKLVRYTENLLLLGLSPYEIAEMIGRNILDVLSFMTDIGDETLREALWV